MILIIIEKEIDRTLMATEKIEILEGEIITKRLLKIKRVEETIVHQMKNINQKEAKKIIEHPRM